MRRRDWAGTVLVACLIALASQLPSHGALVGLLLVAAIVSGSVIAWDVLRGRKPAQGSTLAGDIKAGVSISAGDDIEAGRSLDAGEDIEAGGGIGAGLDSSQKPRARLRIPRRLALVGALVVTGLAISASLVLLTGGGPRPSPNQLDLSGSLLAYDGAAGRQWGKSIVADVTDPLQFHLSLQNHSSKATPLLDVEALYVEPSDQAAGLPWTVWIAVGPPEQETVLHGASAQITPQEGSLGFLTFNSTTFKAQRLGQAAWMQLYSAPPRSNFESPYGAVQTGTAAVLGILGPHEAQLVSFTASSTGDRGLPLPMPFSGNAVSFGHSINSAPLKIGPASPGGTIFFRVFVYSPYGRTLDPVQMRVGISPHPAQHSVTVSAFAAGPNESAQKLGGAVVNAAGTPMISLSVVPGSTRLFGYSSGTCTHMRDLGELSDGIAEGGVEIGSIGGFHPRDPCKGQEFIRVIQFAARVSGTQ
jgi:hypothetical protein